MTTRMDVLVGLIRENSWTRGAELGIWQGQTLFYLLERCLLLHMIGVDRWERTDSTVKDKETGTAALANKDMVGAEEVVRKRAKNFKGRLEIIKDDTVAAAGQVSDQSLDFVFVDADHSTAAVSSDIDAWMPKIKDTGMLLGHDANWPSVRRALDDRVPKWHKLDANVWAWP